MITSRYQSQHGDFPLTDPTHPGRACHPEGCLFCRRHDGGFVGREHIFSESLGNIDEYVLPPGVVCDRCNNGPLAAGDSELVGFEPIAMRRAELGLPTKAGKPVTARFANATVWFSARGQLNIESNSRKAAARMGPEGGKLDLLGRPVTPKRARLAVRSIWKSALELIYLDVGARFAFHEVFDDVRAAILDDESSGWAFLDRNNPPEPHVQLEYDRRPVIAQLGRIPVRFDVFGVVIHTDLLRRDYAKAVPPPWPHSTWTFP